MKILLINSSKSASAASSWRKKKSGLGEIYQLSLISDLANPDSHALRFINKQVATAISVYKIEQVVVFADTSEIQTELKRFFSNLKIKTIQ